MLILNPNPCFTRTLKLAKLVPGAVMRSEPAEIRAGGKGIDLARVARSLGVSARLLILIGEDDLVSFSQLLREEKMEFEYSTHVGKIRIATTYAELLGNTTTIINEETSAISNIEWDRYLALISKRIRPKEIVAIMGSFPEGAPEDFIARVIEMAHANESVVLIDSKPDLLEIALKSGVDIVSPNLDEAEAVINQSSGTLLTGDNTRGQQRAEQAALLLVELGAKIALVHAGSVGAALAFGGKVSFLPSAKVEVKSAVGAGDSFAAGFILKSEEQGNVWELANIDWLQSLRFATATAAAACELGRSGEVDPIRVAEIFYDINKD